MPPVTHITLPALHQAQIEVQTSPARFRTIAAGRRWGKGVLGIGECVKRAAMGKACWWVAPSFASAAYQAGWRMVEFYHSKVGISTLHLQRRTLSFPSKGWLQFKTAEEPDSLRGESLDFVVADEAAHVQGLKQIWELCLRPTLMDRRGEAWFISTPAGFNYFNELWLKGRADSDWASFQYSSHSNPHLDVAELAELTADLPSLVKRQEIDAEFVQLAGLLFQREWIKFLDVAPDIKYVRSWDLAFTKGESADFTAGAKIGMMADGTVVVAHMVHGRYEWPTAVRVVSTTALMDGPLVRQGVESVGAQTGFVQTLNEDPLLAGLALFPIQVTKDKVTRALPLIARGEQGKLALVRGEWNQKFIDELCSFPEGQHDDMVDAASGGLTLLASPTGALSSAKGIFVGPTSNTRHFVPRQFTPRRI